MATDVNTRLQNISTDVSAISNLVNRLVTIYSAGGVQNPDLANLKAELQAWTTTQLGNYATLGTQETFTAAKNFSAGLKTNSAIFYDITKNESDLQNSNLYSELAFCDKSLNNPYTNINSILSVDSNNVRTASLGIRLFKRSIGSNTHAFYLYRDDYIVDGVDKVGFRSFIQNSSTNGKDVNGNDIINYGYSIVNINWLKNSAEGVTTSKVNVFNEPQVINGDVYIHNSNSNANRTLYFAREEHSHGLYSGFIQFNANDVNNEHPYSNALGFYAVGRNNADTSESIRCGFILKAGYSDSFLEAECTAPKSIFRNIVPSSDNMYSLGDGNAAFAHIYQATGAVEVSDKNYKTEISDIPEAVLRAWGKVKFKSFKFKSSVAEKGFANARIHMGVIANEDATSIQKAFESEGLDPTKYGLFCYDEWDDQYEDKEVLVKPEVRGMVKVVDKKAEYQLIFDEDGTSHEVEVSPEQYHMEEGVVEEAEYKTERVLKQKAGHRYSVRYEECLALECAYQRWRLEQIEARLGA